MIRTSKKISINQEKICNQCGECVKIFQIIDNAPICKDCRPIDKPKKKIMNETQMIQKILGGKEI